MSGCCLVAMVKKYGKKKCIISKSDYLDSEDGFVFLMTKTRPLSLFNQRALRTTDCREGREEKAGLNSVHKAAQCRETRQRCWLNLSEGPSRFERHAERGSRSGGRKPAKNSRPCLVVSWKLRYILVQNKYWYKLVFCPLMKPKVVKVGHSFSLSWTDVFTWVKRVIGERSINLDMIRARGRIDELSRQIREPSVSLIDLLISSTLRGCTWFDPLWIVCHWLYLCRGGVLPVGFDFWPIRFHSLQSIKPCTHLLSFFFF